MMFLHSKYYYILLFVLCFCTYSVRAQNTGSQNDKLRVFIDCQAYCDIDYIKREISYVDYVNDRFQASVYILTTSQQTGGGGRDYKLQIAGQGRFSGMSDTLSYVSGATATDDETRKQGVESLKLGLLPFILKTDMAKSLVFSFKEGEEGEDRDKKAENDPWNFWVFSMNAGGYFSGDKNYSNTSFNGGISAGRTTEKLKTNFHLNGNKNKNRYGEGTDEFKYTNQQYGFSNTTVWSLNKHLSAGGDMHISQSDYGNYDLSVTGSAAVEYDLYPYSESSNHYAGFFYRVGPRYFKYQEETIYSKRQELRLQESLSFNVSYNQKWGSVSGAASYSHYFHDLSKNNLSFYGNADLRLTKGLSFNFYGSYSFQRDQLNIIKGDITDQDLLTRRRQLNSDYNFYCNFGLRFQFGSLFNNVVNPRFDR